jgi:hypothetical protein
VHLFEQRLQPVLQLHAAAGQLMFAAHHRAPQPLLDIGHETERQLLGDQPFHQPLRVCEIARPPARASV